MIDPRRIQSFIRAAKFTNLGNLVGFTRKLLLNDSEAQYLIDSGTLTEEDSVLKIDKNAKQLLLYNTTTGLFDNIAGGGTLVGPLSNDAAINARAIGDFIYTDDYYKNASSYVNYNTYSSVTRLGTTTASAVVQFPTTAGSTTTSPVTVNLSATKSEFNTSFPWSNVFGTGDQATVGSSNCTVTLTFSQPVPCNSVPFRGRYSSEYWRGANTIFYFSDGTNSGVITTTTAATGSYHIPIHYESTKLTSSISIELYSGTGSNAGMTNLIFRAFDDQEYTATPGLYYKENSTSTPTTDIIPLSTPANMVGKNHRFNLTYDHPINFNEFEVKVSGNGFAYIRSNDGNTYDCAWNTEYVNVPTGGVGNNGNAGTNIGPDFVQLTSGRTFGSSGDYTITHLQNKHLGRIYRLTIIRSNENGTGTVGFNYFAEQLL